MEKRSKDFMYDIAQTRLKFKRCVGLCRKAGIERFQEQKEFGPWFLNLCEAMEICQPEQSIEPHSLVGSGKAAEKFNDTCIEMPMTMCPTYLEQIPCAGSLRKNRRKRRSSKEPAKKITLKKRFYSNI